MNNCLRLNKDIYSRNIIEKVSDAYTQLCEIQIVERETFFECKFFNTITDTELTMNEFENYLIGLSRKYEY